MNEGWNLGAALMEQNAAMLNERYAMRRFGNHLRARHVSITPKQYRVAALIIGALDDDGLIGDSFGLHGAGKTFLFRAIEDFLHEEAVNAVMAQR